MVKKIQFSLVSIFTFKDVQKQSSEACYKKGLLKNFPKLKEKTPVGVTSKSR